MTIDWSKAPEGATHYCEDAIDGTYWRDLSGQNAKYWFKGGWHEHGMAKAFRLLGRRVSSLDSIQRKRHLMTL